MPVGASAGGVIDPAYPPHEADVLAHQLPVANW